MRLSLRSFRSTGPTLFAVVASLGLLAACGDDGGTEPDPIAGAYAATTFRVTPSGAAEIDVLQQGGALTLTIGANNSTTGALSIPASVLGGAAVQANMVGTVERDGNSISFEQTADTFVRDLNWTRSGSTISVTNQSVGGASYTIVMTR